MARGLILFAHGGRGERWSAPFQAVLAKVRAQTDAPLQLAYLELMSPDLEAAAQTLVDQGVDAIRIVPLFLGEGTHLRRDLPQQLEALALRYPAVRFDVAPAAGEADPVQDALAAYCMAQLGAEST